MLRMYLMLVWFRRRTKDLRTRFTIVLPCGRFSGEDATLVSTPSSTKNETGQREPEMHSTKKGGERA
ncbi:MAG: hypothetical protein Q4D98_01340 [Planctomycetia bacterium]|nr:hypothetical protein [Planctomycetia bacterium]